MNKKLLLGITIVTLCITGCSSVSQEEYDAKTKELETTQEELESAKNKLQDTESELKTIKQEYAEYKQKITEDELKTAGAKAWCEESFGKSGKAYVVDNQVFVILDSKYTNTKKSIQQLWEQIISGARLYSTAYKTMPDSYPYESVTITARDKKTKLDMLTVQFRKNSNGSFSKNAITFNIDDFTLYMKALQ